MPLKPRKTRITKQDIPASLRAYFESGHIGEENEHDAAIFNLAGSDERIDANWQESQGEIMDKWETQHPCSRPWAWWRDAAEPRRRIGGIGTPSSEVLAIAPSFEYGIPGHWVKPFDVSYYNGRAVDIHGKKIGSFSSGDFKGVAINPADPPLFESQASYLQRHGLLTATEKAYLKRHPELLKPEAVTTA